MNAKLVRLIEVSPLSKNTSDKRISAATTLKVPAVTISDPSSTEVESVTDTESTVVLTPSDSLSIDSETGSDDVFAEDNELKDCPISCSIPATSAIVRSKQRVPICSRDEFSGSFCAGSGEILLVFLSASLGVLILFAIMITCGL